MRFGVRLSSLIVFLLVSGGLLVAAKRFLMPRVSDANSYPARDEHPTEKLAIALDPYDTEQKTSIFSTRYLENDLMPILFVVSNHGGQPVLLNGMRVQLVLRNRTKISPADEEDVYRRLTRGPRDDSGVSRNPLPFPRGPKVRVPKEVSEELETSQFRARAIEPGATQAGFFFFDVSGPQRPLQGAHLYVTGVRDSDGQELMFFDIELDKYLAASPEPNKPPDATKP